MIDKIIQWIDRAKSRVYMTYALWLLIIFAPIIFVALFVDQNLLYQSKGLLKNEYITQHYLNPEEWWGWMYVVGGILSAGLMTRLTIWDFPKWFVNRAFSKEIEYSIQRDITRMRKDQRLEDEKKSLANKQLETTKTQVKVVEQKERLESKEEDTWGSDYRQFSKSDVYKLFGMVKDCLYAHGGNIIDRNSYGDPTFELPAGVVAYLDSNNLAGVKNGSIMLTDKGKYFMKRYLDDGPSRVTGF